MDRAVARSGDRHASILERLAQRLERVARELGELVEGWTRTAELARRRTRIFAAVPVIPSRGAFVVRSVNGFCVRLVTHEERPNPGSLDSSSLRGDRTPRPAMDVGTYQR
jgi:hypothetical protein